ncbi:hypothetical protein C8R42DRAFT_710681 [Lentinula raphanica]|nr:hypothetical protein C8R42DRAFT_710681 [Lentinula raphanica]KAJ3828275.1 hypothetical protein F5880DRAFT_1503205 [Lentinula raphanica]
MYTSFTYLLTPSLCVCLFNLALAIPLPVTSDGRTSSVPIFSQLNPRKMVQPNPQCFVYHDCSGQQAHREVEAPSVIQTRFRIILRPQTSAGGGLESSTTLERSTRVTNLVTRYLNQSEYYSGLSSDDFSLVNPWEDTDAAVISFQLEDSWEGGHCNPSCLGMIDMPHDDGNSEASIIHGTLSSGHSNPVENYRQLLIDHIESSSFPHTLSGI